MHGLNWTLLGVDGADMSNRLPLDAVLLGFEKESEKLGLSEHGVGRHRGVLGLMFNSELEVLDPE